MQLFNPYLKLCYLRYIKTLAPLSNPPLPTKGFEKIPSLKILGGSNATMVSQVFTYFMVMT